jgi:hypothetical protein
MRINKSLITYQPASGAGSGTVTSVALSAPTGFTVSGSPVTTSGTLALAFTTGYGIPPLMTGNSGRFLTTNGTTMSWVNIAGTDVTGAALTEVDDTNVTMTLGGTPSTALLRSVSMTLGWAGQLAVGRGGTGASTLTGVVIGNATSSMTAVAGTAGQFLRRNTANTAYEFRTLQGGDIAGSELTFANDTNVTMTLSGTPASSLLQPVQIGLGWTGQLAVGRGGTGASTLTGVLIGNGTSAVNAIIGTSGQILRRNTGNTAYEFWTANYMPNVMTLEGSMIYAATGGTPTELFANNTSTNKYLRSVNGTAPTWEALPASVGGSGTTNYVSKWTASTTLGNSQIFDDGTNVGVNVVTPTAKFHVVGSTAIAATGVSQDTTRFATFGVTRAATASNLAYINMTKEYTTHYSIGIGSNNNFIIGVATETTQVISNPLLSLVSSTGNFGIGTNSPTYKLDVNGAIGLIGNLFAQRIGAYTYLYDDSGNNTILMGNSSQPINVYYNTTHNFQSRSGTNYLTIGSTGIDVVGSANLSSASYLTWGGAYGANIPTLQGTSGTNAVLKFSPAGSTSGVKMELRNDGQLYLNGYTSQSSFNTGTTVGLLGFTSTGAITTNAGFAGSELTKTDDVNVTISLTGTPGAALLQPVSINLGWTGQLSVSRGGTGASTLTGILVGNGTSAVSAVTGASLQILRRNSANTAYEFWSANYLVNPMNLEGQIIYADTGGTPVALAPNSTGTRKYLSQINGTAPSWETISGFLTGSGTTNYVTKWTSSSAVGNSQIIDDGTNVGIGISPTYKLDVSGVIAISGFPFLAKSSFNNVIYDDTGLSSILIGNNTWTNTYYRQGTHHFQSRTSGDYLIIDSTLIDVKSNLTIASTNNLTWGGAYGTDIPTISGTSGSGSNGFLQFYPAGSTSGVKMALRRTGQLALSSYTSSTAFTGTSVATLAVDAAGDVITIAPQQVTASGTYTPTWTGLANVDSVTAYSCQYMRVGDTVTVSGVVGINATVDNTPTSLSLSIPINSDIATISYCAGSGVDIGGGPAASIVGYGSNFAEFAFIPAVDTNVNYSFHFTYRIV